jgi:UDP-N-acetylglucosamine--N-acetylmuramyl-(pentapeptide) pyrophosphoryl-undecaprenol N-acetylglucosamine transferase
MLDLVFFSSPIGLGHATRDLAIAGNLGGVSKRFVSGGAAPRIISQNGFDVDDLYRPPSFRVENGKLDKPLRWLFEYYSYYKQCKEISSQILVKYNPRLVISDEDFASLVVTQEKGLETILVTDILETSFTSGIGSIIEKQMNKSMKKIIQKCDLVIMPEDGKNEDNMIRVGPIVRETLQSREELRNKFGFTKKTIVVSIGGTDSGKFLIEKSIEAHSKIKNNIDLVIVSGPSLEMNHPDVRNLGFVNNLHEIIFAADLIVSLAGKSTIDEARHYGTPGIFVPIKGHFEQEDNARKLGYTHDDISNLDRLMQEKINERRNPQPFDGAKKAVEEIRKFVA